MLDVYKLPNLRNFSNCAKSSSRSQGVINSQRPYSELTNGSRDKMFSSVAIEDKQSTKQRSKPLQQPDVNMSALDEMTEYWKCCEVSDISGKVCAKKNYIEVSTCERCGHWQCDTCTLTTDPNAPPKEYPKPKDPEDTLKRRTSVSLKRAGSILTRTDPNVKGKQKESMKETAIAEGSENQHGVTLVDNGSNGDSLVRKASISLKRAGTLLSRKRQSLAGISKLDGQAVDGTTEETQAVTAGDSGN